MKKILFLILSTFFVSLAATGDITSVTIQPDGWSASMTIEGVTTGGAFALGLGTNNADTANAKIKFTVVSKAFGNNLGDSTVTRRVFGTRQLRMRYPNEATDSVVTSGSDVVVYFALSEYIYYQDNTGAGNSGTAPVVNIAGGVYTKSGTPNNALTDGAVTNSSTAYYQKAFAKWTRPPRSIVKGNFTVAAYGVHQSAEKGKMLRGIKFRAYDQHSAVDSGHVFTTTSRVCQSGLSVSEYVYTVNVTSFTAGDSINVDFFVLPNYGNSAVATNDAVYAGFSPNYTTQTYKYVTDNKLAVVDGSAADDANGAVIDESAFNPASPPAAYKTIGGAIIAGRTAIGGADISGLHLYIRSGNYALYGGSNITSGTMSKYWITFENFPGEAPVIDSKSGSASLPTNGLVKYKGITFSQLTGNMITSENAAWVDSSWIHTHGNATTLYANVVNYLTRSIIDSTIKIPASTESSPCAIVAENTFSSAGRISSRLLPYCVYGNKQTVRSNLALPYTLTGGGSPTCDGGMIFNNYISDTVGFTWFDTYGNAGGLGYAIIGNVWEKAGANTSPLFKLAGDASTVDTTKNIYLIGNTFVGERVNHAYNDYPINGSVGYRSFWTVKSNVIDRYAIVSDMDAHGGDPDASRVGGWPVYFGVSHSDNIAWSAVTGQYGKIFEGINSYRADGTWDDNSNYFSFVANKSGSGDLAGIGDYRPKAGSVLNGFGKHLIGKYDLRGWNAKSVDCPGAYNSFDTLSARYSDFSVTGNTTVSVQCSTLTKNSGDSIKTYFEISEDNTTWTKYDSTEWKIPLALTLKDTLSAVDLAPATLFYSRLKSITNNPLGPHNDTLTYGTFETGSGCTPPTIEYAEAEVCTAYVAFSQSATLAGGTCDSVTGDMPEGLSLNKTTGAVTGVPLSDSVKTAYRIIAWGCDNDTTWDTLTVVYGPVTIDSVAPDTLYSGDSATIYGRHFGPYIDSLSGTMGGEAIDFVSCNNDTIRIVTPTGLDTGYYDLILADSDTSDTLADAFYILPRQFTLTMVNSDPAGTISPTAGEHLLDSNTTQNIEHVPATGYLFEKWTRTASTPASPIADSTDATTTITVRGDVTVTANDTIKKYLLTVTAGTGGTVTPPIPIYASHGIPEIISATVSESPLLGYSWHEWTASGGVSLGDASLQVTTATLTAAGGAAASFYCTPAELTYTITTYECTLGVLVGPIEPASLTGDFTGVIVSPPLPAGLTVNPVDGAIVGVPLARSGARSYNFTPDGNCNPTSDAIVFSVIDTSTTGINYRSINNSINTGINLSIP